MYDVLTPEMIKKHPEIIEEDGKPHVINVGNPVRDALCIMLGIGTNCTDDELLKKAKEFADG